MTIDSLRINFVPPNSYDKLQIDSLIGGIHPTHEYMMFPAVNSMVPSRNQRLLRFFQFFSGKLKYYGKPPCFMGKSSVNMVMLNSYVTNYQRVYWMVY